MAGIIIIIFSIPAAIMSRWPRIEYCQCSGWTIYPNNPSLYNYVILRPRFWRHMGCRYYKVPRWGD